MKNKELFEDLYRSALNNAWELHSEAEILFEHRKYARAYALAFTALEEISKSQLAADVVTGYIEEDEFRSCYRNHEEKITREMEWSDEDYQPNFEERLRIKVKASLKRRHDALYVDIDGTKVKRPSDVIKPEHAERLIDLVASVLGDIWAREAYYGYQIGTKGRR